MGKAGARLHRSLGERNRENAVICEPVPTAVPPLAASVVLAVRAAIAAAVTPRLAFYSPPKARVPASGSLDRQCRPIKSAAGRL